MSGSKIAVIENIGEVTLRKSTRAKRISIRVNSKQRVMVTMPQGVPFSMGVSYAESQASWIGNSLEKVRSYEEATLITSAKNNAFNHLKVDIGSSENQLFYKKVEGEVVKILYPTCYKVEDKIVQNFIKQSITKHYYGLAQQKLPRLTSLLAESYGFNYSKVRVSSTLSSWGSCSSSKNISLSLYLMLLPNHLINYVILHELCHTVEMNHSDKFYNLMNSVTCNRAIALRNELKPYGRQLQLFKSIK